MVSGWNKFFSSASPLFFVSGGSGGNGGGGGVILIIILYSFSAIFHWSVSFGCWIEFFTVTGTETHTRSGYIDAWSYLASCRRRHHTNLWKYIRMILVKHRNLSCCVVWCLIVRLGSVQGSRMICALFADELRMRYIEHNNGGNILVNFLLYLTFARVEDVDVCTEAKTTFGVGEGNL